MPKKAKALKSDESVLSALTNEEGGQYTGLLRHDLPLSCIEHGVPNILIRSLDGLPAAAPANGQEEAGELVGPQCVWIKNDIKEPSGRRLLVLSIRGWLLTVPALNALLTALKSSSVHTLQFWHTGLDESTLPLVAELGALVQCSLLSVEGNTLTDLSSLASLLNKPSLRVLQLRSCSLSDDSLDSLVDPLTNNTSLQQLDLCHNRLSDLTCSRLAQVLRINRTLLSLSLTNNNITDVGVAHIASVLQEFALTHNEVVKRRRMLSNHHDAEWSKISSFSTTSRRSSSKLSRSKDKSKKGDGGKKEPSARAVIASASFIARAKRSAENSKKRAAAAKEKHHTTDDSTTAQHESRPSSCNLSLSACGPLVEDVIERDGNVYTGGNKALINLSLAYNRVGVAGCDLLLSLVKSQREWAELHSDGVVREGDSVAAASNTGLKRLSLHHNMFDEDLDKYQELLLLLPTLTLTTSTVVTPSQ